MNAADLKAAEDLLGGQLGPDAEDCERFTSRYGAALIEIARREADLITALERARHGLVTSQNLRATDLDHDTFDAHIANGVPRDRLEFVIDHAAEIAAIDKAPGLSAQEGQA